MTGGKVPKDWLIRNASPENMCRGGSSSTRSYTSEYNWEQMRRDQLAEERWCGIMLFGPTVCRSYRTRVQERKIFKKSRRNLWLSSLDFGYKLKTNTWNGMFKSSSVIRCFWKKHAGQQRKPYRRWHLHTKCSIFGKISLRYLAIPALSVESNL